MVPKEILDHRLTPTRMARMMPPMKKMLSRLRESSELRNMIDSFLKGTIARIKKEPRRAPWFE